VIQTKANYFAVEAFGNGVAFASGNQVDLYDFLSNSTRASEEGKGGDVTSLSFVPKLPLLVTGSRDGSIDVRNTKSGALLFSVRSHPEVDSILISPDRMRMATLSRKAGIVRVWDVSGIEQNNIRELISLPQIGPPQAISFSPHGKWLSVSYQAPDNSGLIKTWDVGDLR
jgi:WD40 repeat protein